MITLLRALCLLLLLASPAVAAFPTTGLIDDFNRANENPLSEAGNWESPPIPGGGGSCETFKLVSNAIQDDSTADGCGSGQAYWEVVFGPGVEVYASFPTVWNAAGSDGWFWLNGNAEPTAATDGYRCYFFYDTGSWKYGCDRHDNTVATNISADTVGPTLGSGDKLGVELTAAGLFTWYHFPSGGAWGVASGPTPFTDTTYTTGHIGISKGFNDTTSIVDDFSGGTIVASGTSRFRTLVGAGQ